MSPLSPDRGPGHGSLNFLPDLYDEATSVRVAKALDFLGHPLFTATGTGIGPPQLVTVGHHLGAQTGVVKLLLSVPDGVTVDISTGTEPWLDRSTEYTHIRAIELMILDSMRTLEAGVDEEGGLVVQTQVSGRWLEIELKGIEPNQVQIVRIAQLASE